MSALIDQGWQLVSHRKKIKGVEIDLIFKAADKSMIFIEVKSDLKRQNQGFLNLRWSFAQRQRFQSVLQKLQYQNPWQSFFGVLALVSPQKIDFFYLDEV